MNALSDLSSKPPVRSCGARLVARAVASGWLLAVALLVLGVGSDRARAERAGPAQVAPAVAAALDTSRASVDGHWVVAMRAGDVVWRDQANAAWTSAQTGQVVPARSEIETGADGALVLVVGGDRLVMASNSRLVLPPREPGQDQRLHHEHGRLRVDVEPRAGREVEVRTPLLSLGIKGTSFELVVDRRQSSILVLAGVVAVTPPDGGRAIDLGPREGLRQAADATVPPRRLELADLAPLVDRVEPVRWHLPHTEPSEALEVGWSARPVASAPAQPAGDGAAGLPRGAAGAPQGAHRSSGWRSGWLDHQTSLLTILLIAGGGLVILAVPTSMLGQSLRQQWRNRPVGKGRRRRSMIHG